MKGHLGDSVTYVLNSWFQLRSCFQGYEIKPQVGLWTGHGAYLVRFSLSFSLCPSSSLKKRERMEINACMICIVYYVYTYIINICTYPSVCLSDLHLFCYCYRFPPQAFLMIYEKSIFFRILNQYNIWRI